MKREKKKKHFGLLLMFILVLFASGLFNSAVTTLAVYFLVQKGVLQFAADVVPDAGRLMMLNLALSVPVCLMVAAAVSKFPLKPVRDLIEGMDRLASGDFKTRISAGKIMQNYPAYVSAAESFNKLAAQLESTELLHSDFINNFSHEFKTPIVSIAGFAKLLKRGNLPEQEQKQYLSAIEEESMRLSAMATNVLSLTKVENQSILTDVRPYNLSEQVRSCILLLESKWSKKDIELELDLGEYTIHASEELMKQVWINLLDNAVKFTPEGHTIQVRITEEETAIAVEVRNTGSQIPEESQKKIFQKFYQADESHASQGNGIGLAIVKRVTQLHGGRVSVESAEDVTAFRVELPK